MIIFLADVNFGGPPEFSSNPSLPRCRPARMGDDGLGVHLEPNWRRWKKKSAQAGFRSFAPSIILDINFQICFHNAMIVAKVTKINCACGRSHNLAE
jgi:hypothetical protein